MPRSPKGSRAVRRWLSHLVIMLALTATYHVQADNAANSASASDRRASALSRMVEQAEALPRLHALVVADAGEIVLERSFGGPGSSSQPM